MIISRMYTHIFPHSPLLYYTLFCIFHLRPSLPTQPPPVMEISKARQSTLSPHDYVWRLPLPASYPPPHTHAATPGFTRIYYLIFFMLARICPRCTRCLFVSVRTRFASLERRDEQGTRRNLTRPVKVSWLLIGKKKKNGWLSLI